MSQRTDQRNPTRTELKCYDVALKLSAHIMSVCKPKDQNVNNKHIPKRNIGLGRALMECAVEMGADILEANMIYVGKNLSQETRLENYKARIRLQDHAKRQTFRAEHIFRVLYFDRNFADSTTKYMLDLISEVRYLITAWKESDIKEANTLSK